MDKHRSPQRLGFFLPLRIATYVILTLIVMVWMGDPHYLRAQTISYSVLTLALGISLALEKRWRTATLTQVLIAMQFLLEVSLESAVIYATGNTNSPFSALFVLTIVSAALTFRLAGTLLTASLVSVSYAFIIWLGLGGANDPELSMQALRTIFASHEPVFYGIFLHLCVFYLTAFISGYLAERLSQQGKQLADTSSALKRAQLETDDILRHLNSGLLTIDSDGLIVYFNRAAERVLGYREENVRGMHCREVFAERMPLLADCLMEGVNAGITYPRRELEIVNGEGEKLPLGLSTSTLTEDEGHLRGVIAIFSDLTEAKRLERKVRNNDRLAAVGELSASIAHEIRNPLAAISGSVEVLSRELRLVDENARLMELILKESQRLNKILSDFLAYARLDRPSYNKVELCHILSDVRDLLLRQAGIAERVTLELDTDSSYVYVVGDEDLIRQLLLNLAMNACEAFGAEPGRVVLGVHSDPVLGTIDLTVTDNGPGIDPDKLDKIFQPFYSTKKAGTGLGLAIVHRICNALRLRYTVRSTPGEGTVFLIQFSAYRPGRERAAEAVEMADLGVS